MRAAFIVAGLSVLLGGLQFFRSPEDLFPLLFSSGAVVAFGIVAVLGFVCSKVGWGRPATFGLLALPSVLALFPGTLAFAIAMRGALEATGIRRAVNAAEAGFLTLLGIGVLCVVSGSQADRETAETKPQVAWLLPACVAVLAFFVLKFSRRIYVEGYPLEWLGVLPAMFVASKRNSSHAVIWLFAGCVVVAMAGFPLRCAQTFANLTDVLKVSASFWEGYLETVAKLAITMLGVAMGAAIMRAKGATLQFALVIGALACAGDIGGYASLSMLLASFPR